VQQSWLQSYELEQLAGGVRRPDTHASTARDPSGPSRRKSEHVWPAPQWAFERHGATQKLSSHQPDRHSPWLEQAAPGAPAPIAVRPVVPAATVTGRQERAPLPASQQNSSLSQSESLQHALAQSFELPGKRSTPASTQTPLSHWMSVAHSSPTGRRGWHSPLTGSHH
jgi:hypothetical protein